MDNKLAEKAELPLYRTLLLVRLRGKAAPMLPLLKAIVEPAIYTAPADRDRAIILRWVLRDIKSSRLKMSPIDQHDLRDLIDMGLVEMRNDAPALTNTGVDAIL